MNVIVLVHVPVHAGSSTGWIGRASASQDTIEANTHTHRLDQLPWLVCRFRVGSVARLERWYSRCPNQCRKGLLWSVAISLSLTLSSVDANRENLAQGYHNVFDQSTIMSYLYCARLQIINLFDVVELS